MEDRSYFFRVLDNLKSWTPSELEEMTRAWRKKVHRHYDGYETMARHTF